MDKGVDPLQGVEGRGEAKKREGVRNKAWFQLIQFVLIRLIWRRNFSLVVES